MATRRTSRVRLNRRAVGYVELAVADGAHEVAKEIVRTADPPDATPYGVGLVTRGGTMVYKGSKRLDVWSLDGRAPKKPRKFRVAGMGGIVAIAGFSFPARFQEFGTSHNPPQPFLGPAKNAVMGRVKSIMARTVKYRLARGRAA